MREVVFRLKAERPCHLEDRGETLPIPIIAPTLEELRLQAREALIAHTGQADHRSVPAALAAAALRLREWAAPGSHPL